MPSKTEKQKKFFGVVMGAKKGQKGVSDKAKKVAKEMPKKEIKKFLKTEAEEDEQSVSKKIKKGNGKMVFDGPKVKDRKAFAPTTKKHKSEKGKGSYVRKNTAEEDEQGKDCWKGYKKKGTKKKNGRTVNNCIKESNNILKFIESIITKDYANAHKHLQKVINKKMQDRISQEIEKPLF
jgi:hypothetical protein